MFDKATLQQRLPAIAQRHLNEAPTAVAHLGGGSFGMAFRLDFPARKPVVVKFYRVAGMNETEAFQLKLLGKHTSVPMPRPLFVQEDYMGMTHIAGGNIMTNPGLLLKSKAVRQQFAEDVVAGMRQWHAIERERFGELQNPQYDSWPAFYRTLVDEALEGIGKIAFNARQRETLEAATARFDDILSDDVGTPRLIHGDLNIANMMAEPKTLQLTGFIDPFNSFWADLEYDLFQLRNLGGGRFYLYETYKKYAQTSKLCDLKTAYYAAVNEALCYLRSGVKFELLHVMCDQRLRKELKRAGMGI